MFFRQAIARILAFALFIVLAIQAQAAEGGRHALLIGNSNYSNVPRLANPVNDATDLGAALERLGFEITIASDLGGIELNRTLAAFSRKTRDADVAILFFAGHGLEIDGVNYLLPVDAQISHVDDVTYEAIRLENFLHAIGNARTLKLLLVDACRDNPFMRRIGGNTRSLGRGLRRVEPPGGVVVGYAARGGTVALDGDGRNSPYTTALLNSIEEPGLEIGKLFRRVRDNVYSNTNGQQEPFVYGSLPSTDIFIAGPATIEGDFEIASAEGSVAAWNDFLDRHGDSRRTVLVTAATRLRDAAAAAEALALEREEQAKAAAEDIPASTVEETVEEPAVIASLPPSPPRSTLPRILSPQEAESALSLTADERRNAQRLLAELGYDPGPIDGVLGRRTRVALGEFQLASGVQDSGYINQETLAALTTAIESAPISLDGTWRLTLNKRDVRRNGNDKLVAVIGEIMFRIDGRKITVLEEKNLNYSSSPSAMNSRATLDRTGRLQMTVTVNYVPHRNTSRRISVAAQIPERFLVGKDIEMAHRLLSSAYRLEPKLRRLSAGD